MALRSTGVREMLEMNITNPLLIEAEAGGVRVNGVSPTITVTDIEGGYRVNITDVDHPNGQSFDVMDGTATPPVLTIANVSSKGWELDKDGYYYQIPYTPPEYTPVAGQSVGILMPTVDLYLALDNENIKRLTADFLGKKDDWTIVCFGNSAPSVDLDIEYIFQPIKDRRKGEEQ